MLDVWNGGQIAAVEGARLVKAPDGKTELILELPKRGAELLPMQRFQSNSTVQMRRENGQKDKVIRRHGCHASRVRSSAVGTLVFDFEDNPAAPSTIVKQSRKEN